MVEITRSLTELLNSVEDLKGRHEGRTIYVVGCGPQLAELYLDRQDLLSRLNEEVTIAVNYAPYAMSPTYFISAHENMCWMASSRLSEKTIGRFYLKNQACHARIDLPANFVIIPMHKPATAIHEFNGCLRGVGIFINYAASHLAFLMGAKRIVNVAVEMRNMTHFYSMVPFLRDAVIEDIVKLFADKRAVHGWELDFWLRTMGENKDSYFKNKVNEVSGLGPGMKILQDYLKNKGVEFLSTAADSILVDLGVEVRSLEGCLNGH